MNTQMTLFTRWANKQLTFGCTALLLLTLARDSAHAGVAYGTINNFDTVNDTGVECHGFEIELEDIHSTDITYTYDWNHYGTPTITEDNSVPLHPRVRIRYKSGKNPDGSWAAYTAIPSAPIAPTDGHAFTDPSQNFGGEHFGAGYFGTPTKISYHWLVDDGNGGLVLGPAVNVATPIFTYSPPVAAIPAQVQAVIPAPPALPVKEFGPASWVKEIITTSHNNNKVKLRDLVSDDPNDEHDKNWRNGEPDEVEVEWQLLQTDFNKAAGGKNGELAGAPQALAKGDEIITRRYEFYKYLGPIDEETGEAMTESVGPDGIHGTGIKSINGVDVDLSTVIVVGDFVGAQMSAFDNELPVGLVEHLPDGSMFEAYAARSVVIAAVPFTVTTTGALPAGLEFNTETGVISGTPVESGIFTFSLKVEAANNPVQSRNYTFAIAAEGEVLPPHCTVELSAFPVEGGTLTGGGFQTNGTIATVIAEPAPGYAFSNWTENGNIVSASSSFEFTNVVNRDLVANFVPLPPRLSVSWPQPDTLAFTWPTNHTGFLLQQNSDLDTTNWVSVPSAPSVVGTNNCVLISPLIGNRYFRLIQP
jgi:hypothetical protein